MVPAAIKHNTSPESALKIKGHGPHKSAPSSSGIPRPLLPFIRRNPKKTARCRHKVAPLMPRTIALIAEMHTGNINSIVLFYSISALQG